jgi:predicted molibdopterin-dependent oxidoreductase YjgC
MLDCNSSGQLPVRPVKLNASESDEGEVDVYPIPVFLVDDPHHSGHLTEKSHSLSAFTPHPYVEISPGLAAELGVADGDSVRVESSLGKVIVTVRISAHLQSRVALMPRNFSAVSANQLLSRKKRINRVKLSAVSE